MKVEERKIIQDLQAKQAENKDLLERLALEKSWREKEQVNLDKAKTHERDFKEQIVRTEKDLEVEHSGRLRTERDLQELKIKYEAQMEEKRVTLTQAKSLEATLKQMTNDLAELRRNNEELKKKREDIQWVAKSAYDELLAKYNQSKPSPP